MKKINILFKILDNQIKIKKILSLYFIFIKFLEEKKKNGYLINLLIKQKNKIIKLILIVSFVKKFSDILFNII